MLVCATEKDEKVKYQLEIVYSWTEGKFSVGSKAAEKIR